MALSLDYDETGLVADYFADRPAGVMIDVGSHGGGTFKPYLRRGWRVVAFEPDAAKHPALARLAGEKNLTVFHDAVGDVPREQAAFFISDESTGISTLTPFRPSHKQAATVRVVTLAGALPSAGVDRIDFLKIDTEGFDLQVLRGHNFAALPPEVVLAEFDELKTRPQGFGFQAIGDLLLSHGYAVWCSQWRPLVRYGSGHTWQRIAAFPCDIAEADAWGNFVAVRQGADVARMQELVRPHA